MLNFVLQCGTHIPKNYVIKLRWFKDEQLDLFEIGDSVTEMLNNLKWPSLADRRKQSRLAMFYKIHHNFIPIAFENMQLLQSSNVSQLNDVTYKMPRSDTIACRNSFIPRTISDWNNLPQSIVGQPSLVSFKMALTKSN